MEYLYPLTQLYTDGNNQSDSQTLCNEYIPSQSDSGYVSNLSQVYSQNSNHLNSQHLQEQNYSQYDCNTITSNENDYYYSHEEKYSQIHFPGNSLNEVNNHSQDVQSQPILQNQIEYHEIVSNPTNYYNHEIINEPCNDKINVNILSSPEKVENSQNLSLLVANNFLTNPYNYAINENLFYFINFWFYHYVDMEKIQQKTIIDNFKSYLLENKIEYPKTILIEKLHELKQKFLVQCSSDERQKCYKRKTFINIIKSRKNNVYYDQYSINIKQTNFRYKNVNKANKQLYYFLIDKLKELLENDRCSTARDIYYQNMKLFKNTRAVNYILMDIVCTIGVPRQDLNIIAAPKGLVFGDLKLTDSEVILDCNLSTETGVMIPNHLSESTVYESNAKFILIVEKYDVFCHLIRTQLCEKFSSILITGSGFPDLRTRMFTQKLWLYLKIPVFCLVDGDAYGVEIASTFKYGTYSRCYENHHLVLPELRWIGVTADDIIEYELQGIRFKSSEMEKFKSLKERPYLKQNQEWYNQIGKMEQLGIKVEIQALMDYGPNFLSEIYLPRQFRYGKWF